MSTYLAYTRASRPTGRALAQELNLQHYGIRTPRSGTPEILIRWGSRRLMGHPGLVLNQASAIARASDKVRTLEILRDEGIPHVPFFTDWEKARAYGGVILGRDRRGMQGRDIVAYDPTWGILERDHEWFSIYQEPTREMRLHVVGDEVVRIQGKYLDFPDDAQNPYVRNFANGYRFRSPPLDLHSSRKQWAVKAVQALGLDFGAVDLLLFGDDEECALLEVNTAPACSPLTISAYAEAIERKINEYRGGQSPRS